MIKKYKKLIIKKNINLKSAILKLEENEIKMLCYVNSKDQLIGVINDGDIRRAILKYQNLEFDLKKIINKKPIVGNTKISNKNAYLLMRKKQIEYLPILKNKKIVEIKSLKNLEVKVKKYKLSINIMAGGFGKRLRPLTKNLNKCLVSVSKNKKIIDYALENILKLKFESINFFLHYKSSLVRNYIKKKYKNFNSNFYTEKKPLGTIGGLYKLQKNHDSDLFILLNADVVCKIDFEKLIDFHIANKSDFTIVTSQKEVQLEYGLLENLNLKIDTIYEKPSLSFNVNTGVYIFNSNCLKFIKKNQIIDAVSFIKILKKNKKKVISYPIYENWFDLGTIDDLKNFKKFQKSA